MSISQDDYVNQLREQVSTLQNKLGELHSTDANALRRAYKTLCLQIQTLEMESQHINGRLESIQGSSFSPERLGQDFTVAFSIGLGVLGATRLLRSIGAPSSVVGPFSGVAAAAGLFVAALRVVRGMGAHVSDVMCSNRRLKAQLLADWADIRQRIELMAQLSHSGAALLCPEVLQGPGEPGMASVPGSQGYPGPGVMTAGAGGSGGGVRPGSLDPAASLFQGQDSGEVVSPGGSVRSGENVQARDAEVVTDSFTSDPGYCGVGRLYNPYPIVPTSAPNSPGVGQGSGDRQLQSGYELLTREQPQ